ncbi:helix-turn-helix domain-containing protein [Clostridium butyricum]|uniref:helix-turn-helix domain-containing protein n=1 Tax=Clostridium butyricum TaxID=1492 RepID=UPI00129BC78D|nr:helix-turn-helix transcriptional regulator [Clostridium butyricum]QGH20881.1 XRE family transcriptional regulator [Clostridium butyricum]QGH24922.1 XRE family transcriptional regulator [Clostridium butyricum]
MSIIIGEYIKELRKNRKLTQQQLADSVGISQNSVQRYETGKRIPPLDVLTKMAEALNVTLDNILSKDKNSELYKSNIAIGNLKEEAEKEAEKFRKSLKVDAAFCTLCKDCGFKIGIETDDDMSFFGDHVISYKDTDGSCRSFSLTKKQYNHLFQEVRKSMQKEILNSQFYDFLGIGDDD